MLGLTTDIKRLMVCSFFSFLMISQAWGISGQSDAQRNKELPSHLKSGKQIRIENNHYLILDKVAAYAIPPQPTASLHHDELARLDNFSIQPKRNDAQKERPVIWNQSTQSYAILENELGLILNDSRSAKLIAEQYSMELLVQIERLKRAYYKVDANRVPDLMRQLQQDTRIKAVMPVLLESM